VQRTKYISKIGNGFRQSLIVLQKSWISEIKFSSQKLSTSCYAARSNQSVLRVLAATISITNQSSRRQDRHHVHQISPTSPSPAPSKPLTPQGHRPQLACRPPHGMSLSESTFNICIVGLRSRVWDLSSIFWWLLICVSMIFHCVFVKQDRLHIHHKLLTKCKAVDRYSCCINNMRNLPLSETPAGSSSQLTKIRIVRLMPTLSK
jgi:hypothetical protein